MQTHFSLTQLADPDIKEADSIIRACVHCGFCLPTCPTYVLLGDERDSPRGRIYFIKEMLEAGRPAGPQEARHLDRCLTCLNCMTACPSGVDYGHLVEIGRNHVSRTHRRPAGDRMLRHLLSVVLPRAALFRLVARLAAVGRWAIPVLPGRLRSLVALGASTPVHGPSEHDRPQVFPAEGGRRMRVGLLTGCVQQALAPRINAATIRLLTRHGVEVVVAPGTGCCGALDLHMGNEKKARAYAARNVAAWTKIIEGDGLDRIVINTSGCGTTVKDYAHVLRGDAIAGAAAGVAARTVDVTEIIDEIGLLPPTGEARGRVAYHAACSLQHGQGITDLPKRLLSEAGFDVLDVPEGNLCCGAAGTYQMLEPELSGRLRDRKVEAIERTGADMVASGNIGCLIQIAGGTDMPVHHSVELLDWATGGPPPAGG